MHSLNVSLPATWCDNVSLLKQPLLPSKILQVPQLAMTTRELGSRLKTLSEVHRETSQLIARLSKLPIQPGSTSSNPDARVELSSEIHQRLKEEDEELELLKQEAEDITSGSSWGSAARRRDSEKDRERIGLVSQVERLGEDLKL